MEEKTTTDTTEKKPRKTGAKRKASTFFVMTPLAAGTECKVVAGPYNRLKQAKRELPSGSYDLVTVRERINVDMKPVISRRKD